MSPTAPLSASSSASSRRARRSSWRRRVRLSLASSRVPLPHFPFYNVSDLGRLPSHQSPRVGIEGRHPGHIGHGDLHVGCHERQPSIPQELVILAGTCLRGISIDGRIGSSGEVNLDKEDWLAGPRSTSTAATHGPVHGAAKLRIQLPEALQEGAVKQIPRGLRTQVVAIQEAELCLGRAVTAGCDRVRGKAAHAQHRWRFAPSCLRERNADIKIEAAAPGSGLRRDTSDVASGSAGAQQPGVKGRCHRRVGQASRHCQDTLPKVLAGLPVDFLPPHRKRVEHSRGDQGGTASPAHHADLGASLSRETLAQGKGGLPAIIPENRNGKVAQPGQDDEPLEARLLGRIASVGGLPCQKAPQLGVIASFASQRDSEVADADFKIEALCTGWRRPRSTGIAHRCVQQSARHAVDGRHAGQRLQLAHVVVTDAPYRGRVSTACGRLASGRQRHASRRGGRNRRSGDAEILAISRRSVGEKSAIFPVKSDELGFE
eukprot:scaffold842_cov227-Pinguiococcus_pyrenoidosus.AAC.17